MLLAIETNNYPKFNFTFVFKKVENIVVQGEGKLISTKLTEVCFQGFLEKKYV